MQKTTMASSMSLYKQTQPKTIAPKVNRSENTNNKKLKKRTKNQENIGDKVQSNDQQEVNSASNTTDKVQSRDSRQNKKTTYIVGDSMTSKLDGL